MIGVAQPSHLAGMLAGLDHRAATLAQPAVKETLGEPVDPHNVVLYLTGRKRKTLSKKGKRILTKI